MGLAPGPGLGLGEKITASCTWKHGQSFIGGGGGGGQCFWGIRRLSSLSHIWMQGKGTASMVSARMFWVFSPAAQLAKAQQITESRIQVPIGRVKMAGWSK
jgi:hypothetical protein